MSTLCADCSSPLDEGSPFCAHCGSSVSGESGATVSAQPTVAEPVPFELSAYRSAKDLEVLGGWLILPAIGLAITPFITLYYIFGLDLPILLSGRSSVVFVNHPGLASLLIFEIAVNAIFLTCVLGLNFLFYAKKSIFPKCMIAYLVINFFLLLADHLATASMFPSVNSTSGMMSVVRAFTGAAVWIPYFLNSNRVEQTFVN